MKYITEGFEAFRRGSFENGGQNLYVSRKGVLQRIFQYDVNQDGYPDLPFANSQSMNERPPVFVYRDLPKSTQRVELPSGGTYDGLTADLFQSGYPDLVLACQHNGTHSDICAILYFGNADGYSEQYRMELPVPNATSVCAGDFDGCGQKALSFASNGTLRIFRQAACGGYDPAAFSDYPIDVACLATADLDGDGKDELILKTGSGKLGILWGGNEPISEDRIDWLIGSSQETTSEGGSGSTAGLLESSAQWRPYVIHLNGKTLLFAAEGENAVFYGFSDTRAVHEEFRVHCPGVVATNAGKLTGQERDDLVLTVFAGRDQEAQCRVYPAFTAEKEAGGYISIPVKGAVSALIANIQGNVLIFSRIGEKFEQEVPTSVLRYNGHDGFEEEGVITCGDCMRILAGAHNEKTDSDEIIVLNHKLNRAGGSEEVTIYLGGEDGYQADQKITLRGHSTVDTAMCDFFDRGLVDVLLCNCCEDEPSLNQGACIFPNNGNGFDDSSVIELPSLHTHGAAIGDFRKSGYLDIAVGGIFNREIRIFHGGPQGYRVENSSRVVLSPDDGYVPLGHRGENGFIKDFTPEQKHIVTQYGQVRWLLAADFNNDGWLDIFVSEICGEKSFILWGGPDGFSFERRQELLTDGVASAAVADLNGNGWPDLILAQHQSLGKKQHYESYVTVYWGGLNGYQENRKMQLPAKCANSVTVGDYNGNGSLDIYATSYNNGRDRDLLSFLYKGENGKYSASRVQYLFNHSGCGCVSGDFNGDGYTDLAVAFHKTYGNHVGKSVIFWGGPDGLSEERKTELPTAGPHGMSTIDPGNIMNRGEREHYLSEPLTLKPEETLQSVEWEGRCTSTSWVEIEVRAADCSDRLEDAEWKRVTAGEDVSNLCLSGVVQYRLALCAKCACGTPRVTKVILNCKENA